MNELDIWPFSLSIISGKFFLKELAAKVSVTSKVKAPFIVTSDEECGAFEAEITDGGSKMTGTSYTNDTNIRKQNHLLQILRCRIDITIQLSSPEKEKSQIVGLYCYGIKTITATC